MNYQESLDFISASYSKGIKLGLENSFYILEKLGNPQDQVKVIHLAGTNGKGSTAAIIASILQASGYKVGLYTSPYLQFFNERIQINRKPISNEDLAASATVIKREVERSIEQGQRHPTEFEIVTAIAFYYFANQAVDFLVLEVGMGGRFDTTNVVKHPLMTIITPISMDHSAYLGDSISDISYQKAGIIKEAVPVVVAKQDPVALQVIEKIAKQKHAPLYLADETYLRTISTDLSGQTIQIDSHWPYLPIQKVKLPLLGAHQKNNLATALEALNILLQKNQFATSWESVFHGIEKVKWAGRFEVLQTKPPILIDGAHNPHGAQVLAEAIRTYLPCQPIHLLIGVLADKDMEHMLHYLIPIVDRITASAPSNPRAMTADELEKKIRRHPDYHQIPLDKASDPKAAFLAAKNNLKSNEALVVAGSLYLIGEIRNYWQTINKSK